MLYANASLGLARLWKLFFLLMFFKFSVINLEKPDNVTNFQSRLFRISYSKTDVVVVCL